MRFSFSFHYRPSCQSLLVASLLSMLSVVLTSCPGGEVSSLILGNKINSAVDKISWGLERSIANADYRMEKNLRTLQIMTTNIQQEFNKEMERNRNFISEEMTKNIDKIHLLIDDVKGGILEVEDFLVLDAQSLINQIPFKKDIFLVRRIDGYSTAYKENGTYDFQIIGNAFQPGKIYKVKIDDLNLEAKNLQSSAANRISFAIPASRLNGKFLKFAINRAKLEVSCFEKEGDKAAFFILREEILLLPRYPVTYVFSEYANNPIWSQEKAYKQFSFDLGPTGENGRWERVGRNVTVDNASTQRFTRVVTKAVSGSHAVFGEESFTPDFKTYNVIIANQCHDCSRTFYGTLEYETLQNTTALSKRFFESDPTAQGLLTYGIHTLSLSEHYQLFELTLTFFNGEQVFLSKEALSDTKNGCKVSIAKGENGELKRLALQIDKK